MRVAIVTGASGGLGKVFVEYIAAHEAVDEIWAIARNGERLRELAEETPIPVRPLPMDLTDPSSGQVLEQALKTHQPDVTLLVNNAGYGIIGTWENMDAAQSTGMVDLNCRALVWMTLQTLPFMQKGARILQIASVAAFAPLPTLNLYAASKAFVLRYSRALRWETMSRGIHVTAVCPYWIRDTEFIGKAKQGGNQEIRSFPFAQTTGPVVRRAMCAARINAPVCTPGVLSFLLRLCTKFIPHELIIALWQGIRRL